MTDLSLSQLVPSWIAFVIAVGWMFAIGYFQRRAIIRGKRSQREKAILAAMCLVFIGVYIYITLLYREPFSKPRLLLKPFRSYRRAFKWDNGLSVLRRVAAKEIWLNILLYIPIGFTLPGILWRKKHPVIWSIIFGALFSCLTEGFQYVTRRGYVETDDLINNTFGALIGICIYECCFTIWKHHEKQNKSTKRYIEQ